MKNNTWLDIFCGGGGAGLGLHVAGFNTVGIELNSEVAKLYQQNVSEVHNADFTKLNPSDYLGVIGIHASPPCQQYSAARSKSLPVREDANVGELLCDWLRGIQPQYFTLENVQAYRRSEPFKKICNTLSELGYGWNWKVINMADYGIPQSRTRLILWASKGQFAPALPATQKWMGWYQAIEDLLPELPKSNLTQRQIETLQKKGYLTQLIEGHDFTATRAVLVDGQRAAEALCISDDLPSATTRTGAIGRTKAVLIERCGTPDHQGRSATTSPRELPVWTLRSHAISRKTSINALLEGADIRRLNTQAIARLQTFPDSYQWSGRHAIDGLAIGNAVPPKFMQMLAETLTQAGLEVA